MTRSSPTSPATADSADPVIGGKSAYTFQLLDVSRKATPTPVAVTTLSHSGSGRIGVGYAPLGR